LTRLYSFLQTKYWINQLSNDYETEFGIVQWFLETRLQNVLIKNWEHKPDHLLKKVKTEEFTNSKKLCLMEFKENKVEQVENF
jgi:hypothetical protein